MSYRSRPTIYNGVSMRSRLEASFAAFLDLHHHEWLYEPQCFADSSGQYLPDFRVAGSYLEVKPPTANVTDALAKMHIIRSSEPEVGLGVVVPVGEYPYQGWKYAAVCDDNNECWECGLRRLSRRPRGGYPKCSQEETDAFLADRPYP